MRGYPPRLAGSSLQYTSWRLLARQSVECVMPQVRANKIDIEYESFGSVRDETILLIMGLGSQLTRWPVELCHALVA
jgi:hypothetical protein